MSSRASSIRKQTCRRRLRSQAMVVTFCEGGVKKNCASLGRYLVCEVVEAIGVLFAWIHTAFRLDVDARASGGG